MIHLAIDLGTKCGWAAHTGRARVGGTWRLTTESDRKKAAAEDYDRRCDPRFAALLDRLYEFRVNHGAPDVVIFEDVRFSEYTLQTQLWSSLRAAIWAYGYFRPDTCIQCIDTSRLKVWATGHGNATKAMMGAWLVKKHPKLFVKNPEPIETCFVLEAATGLPVDDNQADAQHLLDYSLQNFP